MKCSGVGIDMAMCIVDGGFINICDVEVLSKSELVKYESFKVKRGRQNFLLGRYAAKQAYVSMTCKNRFTDIEIRNGIFNQPFFPCDSKFDVSITHSALIAGAVVFDRAYPLGLDIEYIDESKLEVLKMTAENNEMLTVVVTNKLIALTLLWCLKEALSKAIKTGVTIPFKLLETANLIRDADRGFFLCEFKNFPQYRGLAKVKSNYVVALAYPRQLEM